jgi:hypothetical protein
MNTRPHATDIPPESRITRHLAGADFHDAWAVQAQQALPTALDHFLHAVRATPRWVALCMQARNAVAARLGLKHLGALQAVAAGRPGRDHKPGERVGIFTLLHNEPDEVLLGERDKHLDVWVSLHVQRLPDAPAPRLTLSTVVHIHNRLGRVYMLPVVPMHRLIVPAMLGRLA